MTPWAVRGDWVEVHILDWERMPMRNDVKLGLAVGGILLAVLIVYVLVVPGSQQPGADLATTDGTITDEIASDSATLPEANGETSSDAVNPEESVVVPPKS